MSTIDRLQLTGTESLALKLVWAFAAAASAERPIDQKIESAKLHGMTIAANALGFGHTEYEVSLEVHEVMRDRPLPAWKITGVNAERDAWERDCMVAVTTALNSIYSK